MSSTKAFRDFALKCMLWAAQAGEEKQRLLLLEMAAYWMRAAVALEKPIALVDDNVSLIPQKDEI
jgi:hypothetical protein